MSSGRPFVFLLTGNNVAANVLIDKVLEEFPEQEAKTGRGVNVISRKQIEKAAGKGPKGESLARNAAAFHEIMNGCTEVDENGHANAIICLYDYPATVAELEAVVEYSEGTQFPLLDSIVRVNSPPDRATVLAQEDDDLVLGEPATESVSEPSEVALEGDEEGEAEAEAEEDPHPEPEAEGADGDVEDGEPPVSVALEPSAVSTASKSSVGLPGRTFPAGIPLRDYLERIVDLKALLEKMTKDREGYWMDVTFHELNVADMRDEVSTALLVPGKATEASLIEDALVRKASKTCIRDAVTNKHQKDSYRKWALNTTMVPVATDTKAVARTTEACMDAAEGYFEGIWSTEPLYQRYRECMAELPTSAHSPAASLFSMVETLDDEAAHFPLQAQRDAEVQKVLSPSGPGGFITFGQDEFPGTCAEVLSSACSVSSNSVLGAIGTHITKTTASGGPDVGVLTRSGSHTEHVLSLEDGNLYANRMVPLRPELMMAFQESVALEMRWSARRTAERERENREKRRLARIEAVASGYEELHEDETLEDLQAEEPEPELEWDEDLYTLPRASAKLLAFALFEKRALALSHVARFWGSGEGKLPLQPSQSYTERAVLDSEIMTITSLSLNDFHRFRQMQQLDALVQQCLPKPPTFTEKGGRSEEAEAEEDSVLHRRYSRELSAFAFPQIVTDALLKEPSIYRSYYSPTDELLVALTWPPPHRRAGEEVWNPMRSMRLRASFAEYSLALAAMESESTGGQQPAQSAQPAQSGEEAEDGADRVDANDESAGGIREPPSSCIDIPTSFWERFSLTTTTLTPAGRSLAILRRAHSTGDSWLTIYEGEYMVGLRDVVRLPTAGTGISIGASSSANKSSASVPVADESEEVDTGGDAEPVEPVTGDVDADVDGGGDGGEQLNGDGEQEMLAEASQPEPSVAATSSVTSVRGKRSGFGKAIKGSSVNTTFFCHCDDGTRITVTSSPGNESVTKPDGLGTVSLAASFANGMTTTVCSNGTVRVHCVIPGVLGGAHSLLGEERERVYGAGGLLIRRLVSGPYEEDILCPDGTRTLVRRNFRDLATALAEESENLSVQASIASAAMDKGTYAEPTWGESFHHAVQKHAPEGWTHVTVGVNGGVRFYVGEPSMRTAPIPTSAYPAIPQEHPDDEEPVSPFAESSTVRRGIDAETQASVAAFSDGRVIVEHTDGLREVVLADGTRVVSHPSRKAVFVERAGMPGVEYDLECDDLSWKASRGEQIPLNKGGINSRVRVCMPDGAACTVKYDTRSTSEVNGSIRMVRRDRALIDVLDGGVVSFAPPNAWTPQNEADYQKDLADTMTDVELRQYGRLESGADQSIVKGGGGSGADSRRMGGTLDAASSDLQSTSKGGSRGNRVGFDTSSSTADLGLNSVVLDAAAIAAAKTLSPRGDDRTRRGGVAAGLSVEESEPGQDSLIQSTPKDTKFTFDVEFKTVHIVDFEHNDFKIDLYEGPTAPTLTLAGEVDGLAPTAVTESPIEPRLFVLGRRGVAREVVCPEEIRKTEKLAIVSQDTSKYSSEVIAPKSDLGGSLSHTYFTRRYGCSGPMSILNFADIYPVRRWHCRPRVSAAATALSMCIPLENLPPALGKPVVPASEAIPSVYRCRSYVEMMPLSRKGYDQLTNDMQQWQKWTKTRMHSMNRFKLEDTRGQEELDLEKAVRAKLDKAYRKARQDQKRAREKAARRAAGDASSSVASGSVGIHSASGAGGVEAGGSQDLSLPIHLTSVPEAEEDGSVGADSDDDNETEDPVSKEFKSAFEAFCEVRGNHRALPHAEIRGALTQVMNVMVPRNMVDEGLQHAAKLTGGALRFDDGALDGHEWRSLCFFVREQLDMIDRAAASPAAIGASIDDSQVVGGAFIDDYGGGDSPQKMYAKTMGNFDLENGPSAELIEGSVEGGPGGGSSHSATFSGPMKDLEGGPQISRLTPGGTRSVETGYWESHEGDEASRSLPPSRPPLNYRPLDWSVEQELIDGWTNVDESGQPAPAKVSLSNFNAVGSALRAAKSKAKAKVARKTPPTK